MKENKTMDCFISGHNLKPDLDSDSDQDEIITDLNNITHLKTKCVRCGQKIILHLDEKKSL